jgi:hypothetical protein
MIIKHNTPITFHTENPKSGRKRLWSPSRRRWAQFIDLRGNQELAAPISR